MISFFWICLHWWHIVQLPVKIDDDGSGAEPGRVEREEDGRGGFPENRSTPLCSNLTMVWRCTWMKSTFKSRRGLSPSLDIVPCNQCEKEFKSENGPRILFGKEFRRGLSPSQLHPLTSYRNQCEEVFKSENDLNIHICVDKKHITVYFWSIPWRPYPKTSLCTLATSVTRSSNLKMVWRFRYIKHTVYKITSMCIWKILLKWKLFEGTFW